MSAARMNVLYFGHVPVEGAGSAIIVLRHLRRIQAAGGSITVVPDWGQDVSECTRAGWRVAELSHRRKWWPPFDPQNKWSRRLRAWLWAGELRGALGAEQPRAVLTYLSAFSDTLSLAAAGFARRYCLPLLALVHDDVRCFTPDAAEGHLRMRNYRDILGACSSVGFASPDLARAYGFAGREDEVLAPIPEGFGERAKWQATHSQRPRVVYAGNYWEGQLPLLARAAEIIARAGGELVLLVKPSPAIEALCKAAPIRHVPPFPTNREALSWLVENAAGLLVAYGDSSDTTPWIRASFPSKLIEYVHLGVPLMIVAPEDTAVAHWAQTRAFPHWLSPANLDQLAAWVGDLSHQESWTRLAAAGEPFALGEFDPAKIHAELERRLWPVAR